MKTKIYFLLLFCFVSIQLTSQEINILKDLNPNNASSNATNFKVFNGNLCFTALDKIYISNGETTGTNILSTNLKNGQPNKGVELNENLYFPAQFDENSISKGEELCVYNGTSVSLIQDINPNEASSDIENLIAHNGKIYFSADNGTQGRELWVYDQATNVTSLLKNIRQDNPNIAGSNISNMVIHNNLIYFTAQENTSVNDLWKTDGTTSGTVKVPVIIIDEENEDNNIIGTKIEHLINFNGELYFSASENGIDKEVWAYDGVNNTTRIVKDIKAGASGSNPKNFIEFNNELLFTASSEQNRGDELFKTDGTEEGTVKVKRLNTNGTASVYMNTAFEFNDKLFFNVLISADTYLFSTDGTEGETQQIQLLADGSNGGIDFFKPVAYNNKIYFRGINNDDVNDNDVKIWETNGLPNQATEVIIDGFIDNYQPREFIVYNNKLYFTAIHQTFGNEIFTLNTINSSDYTEIPDTAFEQYLIDEQIDTGEIDGRVLTASIAPVTDLNMFDKGITDLTGIQDFTSLEQLDISNNTIEILDLSENNTLKFLYCVACSLENIDVTNNVNLEVLTLMNNNFSAIDVTQNTALKALDISTNTISTLDVSQNTNLTSLTAFANQLQSLNLETNGILDALFVQNNELTALNLKNGNNSNFKQDKGAYSFNALENPNLSCIQVDDVNFADTNFTNIDAAASFSTDCTAIDGQTYVPDDNFEEALIALNLDTDLDDYITTANINTLENLDISNLNITDLTGLQDFVALKTLNISNNLGLVNIDVSAQINLEILDCSDTNISQLDITKNTALKTLSANNNSLSAVDFSNNFNLKKLSVNNNMFVDFPVDFLYAIQELDCSNNQIKAIETTSLLQLTSLICNNNNIQKLFFSGTFGLTELIANNNNLNVLDLKTGNLEIMQSFNITNNENLFCVEVDDITYATTNLTNKDAQTNYNENCGYFDTTAIPDPLFEQALIDLELDDVIDQSVLTINIKNLKTLLIQNTNIDVLTGLEAFVSLENLTLINLSIDEIDLSTLTNLEELNLFRNQLPQLDVTKNINLEILLASENSLSSIDLSKNTNLKRLNLNYNEFKSTINLSTNDKLQFLDILGNAQGNQITSIDLSNNPLLEEVQIQENLLNTIDISSNLNLKKLSVPSNNILTIDVSNNGLLERLSVSNNNLSSLTVKANEQLQFLSTVGNNLTCVSVFNVDFANTQFTQFADDTTIFVSDCNNIVMIPDTNFEQKLIDLEIDNEFNGYVLKTNIENIEILNISTSASATNKIENLTGIEDFTNLKNLRISFNNIQDVNLSNNINLQKFNAQFCNITNLILPNTQSLQTLDLHSNNISSLDLSNYVNLRLLQINANNLTSIDVSQNTDLETLYLSSNALNSVDVSKNTKLKILGVSFTGISEIDISKNNKLELFQCDRNNLTSLNVSNNRALTSFDCSKNNLSILNITNNIRLTDFEAKFNDLTCINTFDVDFANTNWSNNIDAEASFGTDCYTAIPDTNFEEALIEKGFDTTLDGYIVTSIANNVTFLGLATSNIQDLTGIEAFTALTGINLKGNNLTSVDLSSNTLLNNLNISNNFRLDRLDISNNTNLDTFEAFNVELTCIKVWDVDYANSNWSDKIDSDVVFSLDCNDVWTVDVDDKTQAVLNNVPGLDANNDGKITISEAEAFGDDLDLSNKNLDDIKGLQSFSNIKSLNLSGNNLKDLSALTGKKITLISKTTGKKRDVEAKSSGLETLIISNNSFETLNLEELKSLKVIDLSNNPNLGTISIKNGNNAAITNFNSTNTPNLSCIIVDDTNATYLANFNKDEKSNFVKDLADCRSKVLSTDSFLQKDVKVFPNPVTNFLTIETLKEFDSIEIYNSIGKRIIKTKSRKINFTNFTSGIYMMRIIAENKVLTKKVIKN